MRSLDVRPDGSVWRRLIRPTAIDSVNGRYTYDIAGGKTSLSRDTLSHDLREAYGVGELVDNGIDLFWVQHPAVAAVGGVVDG